MIHRLCALVYMIFLSLGAFSQDKVLDDKEKMSFFDKVYEEVKKFSRVDTNYIEPQRYNFTLMLQNTNTIERYTLSSKNGNSIGFSPEPNVRIGPYFGWRWLFLGYTLDVNHLHFGSDGHSTKKEFDVSLYSNQIGLDVFYRRTGTDYKVRGMWLSNGENVRAMENASFSGLEVGITGFNLYYIFNHRRFSYPAAYSQSTVQRRSAGSPLIGIGYTRHSLKLNWDKLNALVAERTVNTVELDSSLYFNKVEYSDISISGGYAYNWVFAKNWLFDVSASLGVGYKYTKGDAQDTSKFLGDFSFHRFNIDAVFRAGLVWNNTRWFAGANAIMHSYNYSESQFSTNNTFGSVNVYVGFNFGKK